MSDSNTNYGVILGLKSAETYTAIGEVLSIDPPELVNEAVEATNHSSGGWREYISGGLKELSEFKATVAFISADTAVQITALKGGTLDDYQIEFPNGDKWQFKALVTKIKPMSADAEKPEVAQAEITFRPSGESTIA